MNDVTNWKVPKWPFFLADALLMVFGYYFVLRAPAPVHHWEIAAGCVAFGAVLGVLPFYLDYRAMGKVIEISVLGSVGEKIQNLEQLAAQISSATNQWEAFQGIVQGNSDKTVATAKGIASKMAEEVRQFSEFMQKMNDSEKATLRLEVEKFRRGEGEWLQALVRILDHVFALHTSAIRTGDAKFAEPIANFQSACRDTVRRIGLKPFVAEPNEPFDAEKHQVAGSKEKPPTGSVVAETIGAGYTFQGKLLRLALVRLREVNSPAKPIEEPLRPGLSARENLEDPLPAESRD
jgi:molecular chaperone GrpE (heat shock protein)